MATHVQDVQVRSPHGSRPSPPPARTLTRALFKPWARWAANAALVGRNRSRETPTRGRFTRNDVRRLLKATWEDFNHLSSELPDEPTVGSRLNVMLASLTLAMLNALTEEGISRDYAIDLISDACWKIYAQWGHLPQALSRAVTRDPAKRMRISVNAFLRFPFNRPGYCYHDVPEPEGRSLDMLRCPVADYLSAHDASDLTVGTWCNLDFQLARMWGGTLQRQGTLAGGAPKCDFRFRSTS